MPKNYGIKEKDQVVAHILELLLDGRLRTGDRVDRNRITATLGLSRVPVQEALVQLEHDGILETRYHRGAYAKRFDEDVVREHHEVHALLIGAVSARAASDRRAEVLEALDEVVHNLRNSPDPRTYVRYLEQYRILLIDAYAGPKLHAAIYSSRALVPSNFWSEYPLTNEVLQPFVEAEFQAIRTGRPDKARRNALDCLDVMADHLIADMNRRGVFADLDS